MRKQNPHPPNRRRGKIITTYNSLFFGESNVAFLLHQKTSNVVFLLHGFFSGVG